jgi:hypothetical protein
VAFLVIRSGILKSLLKTHLSGFYALTPHRLTQRLATIRKWRHFACPFGALRGGILQIWKTYQNLEILRNLAFILDVVQQAP